MSRPALLLGLMVADFTLVIALSIPVLILGAVVGVSFSTGIPGALLFLLLAGLWGLAFTGFPYAIALKTGNPAAVNSSFLLFFPFAFLTTAFLPQEALTGWLSTVATYNPVTYVLAALRSLLTGRLAGHAAPAGAARHPRRGRRQPHPGLRRPARTGLAPLMGRRPAPPPVLNERSAAPSSGRP